MEVASSTQNSVGSHLIKDAIILFSSFPLVSTSIAVSSSTLPVVTGIVRFASGLGLSSGIGCRVRSRPLALAPPSWTAECSSSSRLARHAPYTFGHAGYHVRFCPH